LPFLDLSSFLAAVLSSSKADILRKKPHTTLLIPRNEAFKRLGSLVSNHLLSASAKSDLENVLLHHTLDSVAYEAALAKGSQHSFATIEGSDVTFQRTKNGTMFVGASGGWAGLKAEITPRNLLTQTGVIHEVSDILIPRSVEITVGKLVKAAKGTTMATLVNKAGFEWVLNGTSPPEGSPWADQHIETVGWTLLCPPDDAFKEYNLTQLYADEAGLKAIVEQHLIPVPIPQKDLLPDVEDTDSPLNSNSPLVLDDATYTTMRSAESVYGDIVFQKQEEDGHYVVGIKGARGTEGGRDYARLLSWGRSTTGSGAGGVIQIDRLLVPYQPKWWVEYGAPTAVGSFGTLAICAFFYGVRILWQKDTTEATYEPVGGFGHDDDDE
jgi:solute carrier family 25 carnitine/acylcarnitine transporter 20/29